MIDHRFTAGVIDVMFTDANAWLPPAGIPGLTYAAVIYLWSMPTPMPCNGDCIASEEHARKSLPTETLRSALTGMVVVTPKGTLARICSVETEAKLGIKHGAAIAITLREFSNAVVLRADAFSRAYDERDVCGANPNTTEVE